MSLRILMILGLLSFGAVWLASRFQTSPGYMDADYYYIGGLRLAQGAGFNEQVLWNYLDDPVGLPHPSHGYWSPLASLAAAGGMQLFGRLDFAGGRMLFLLVAALIPALTACLAYALHGRKSQAVLSGVLAVFPGFYLPYLCTTDSFGLTMVAGALFFNLLHRLSTTANTDGSFRADSRGRFPALFALGALAGVISLARADGIIWLVAALFFAWLARNKPLDLAACLAGYLVIFGPWMARNLAAFGAPMAPGGSAALWITRYDELYSYPADLLTPARWLQSGFPSIIQARLSALGTNLQSALAVQGQIFLAPLALIGFWKMRQNRAVQAGGLIWLLTFMVMSLVFPFQGERGGFFHSGAAVQPLVWAVAPVGFESLLAWAGRKRSWNLPQARRFFTVSLVLMAAILTMALTFQRLGGDPFGAVAWDSSSARYTAVEAALQSMHAPNTAVVMVNNPPGYYAAVGRPAIAIPFGDLATLLEAAHRYKAEYLLLELDQVLKDDLYARPGDRPGLHYLGTTAETRIYAILKP